MGPATCLRAGLLVVGLTLTTATARTEDLAAARLHFQRGEEHYRQERFQDAFGEYQAAYAAAPLPDFLFNMGQCQRKLGNRAAALELYRKFLDTNPPPDRRAITLQVIAEIEAEAPEQPPDEVSPAVPSHARPDEVSVGSSVPAEPPPETRPPGRRIGLATWLVLGGSAALFGVAGYFALRAESEQSDLDELDCARELSRCFETRDEAEQAFLLRNVFLAAGGAALAATTVLVALDLSRGSGADSPRDRPDVVLVVAPGTIGVQGGTAW